MKEIVEKSIKKNEAEAIDLNTDQLYSGIDSLGNSLGTYTEFTKRQKRAKGQPSDRVTLKDEGDFYDGFNIRSKKFPFILDSSDSKTDMLADKYGDDIFGLTPKNTKEYAREIVLPFAQDRFKEEIKKALSSLR